MAGHCGRCTSDSRRHISYTEPLLLPAEVLKVGVTHTFVTDKARRELGYRPLIHPDAGMADTVRALLAREKRDHFVDNWFHRGLIALGILVAL